jgi:small acid-soluble spore protein E (minor gamma-type SASP)
MGGDVQMAKKSQSETNAQKVRQQNNASAQGGYNAEFASETDAAAVRQKNQQSQANKQG